MKKLIIPALIIVAVSGCKKDWVCGCTDQDGNYTAHNITNQTLMNARSKCKAMDYDQTVLGIHTSESCSLQ